MKFFFSSLKVQFNYAEKVPFIPASDNTRGQIILHSQIILASFSYDCWKLTLCLQAVTPNSHYKQIAVEQQRYANCGPEIVENFILSLTGNRVSQEKAIELHSKLVENSLLDLPISNTHLLFEQPDYHGYQPDIGLSGNYDQETC